MVSGTVASSDTSNLGLGLTSLVLPTPLLLALASGASLLQPDTDLALDLLKASQGDLHLLQKLGNVHLENIPCPALSLLWLLGGTPLESLLKMVFMSSAITNPPCPVRKYLVPPPPRWAGWWCIR